MRILHFIYDHPGNPWVGGGGAVRAHELSLRLARRGHTVTIVSGRYPGARDYAHGGLECRFVGSDRGYAASTFSYALSASAYALRHADGYDVVVEDFAPWNPVFTPLLTRTPAVLHVNHREGRNILRRWRVGGIPFYVLERVYHRLFTHMTALSEWTRRKVGHPGAIVLPAGIGEELAAGILGAGAERRTGHDGFVLYVGRHEIQNKGLDTLIEAMRLMGGRVRLRTAGRGRDEGRVREMARGLETEFLGFVDEGRKARLMREAALFVLPSRFEGWGIVVLEAAACGAPVVVSDIPELSFAVEGGFGASFRTGDARALARTIEGLMGDPARRALMGERGVQYAKDYTWDRIASQYEAFLGQVIRTPRP